MPSFGAPSILDIALNLAVTVSGNLANIESALLSGGRIASYENDAIADAIAAKNAASDAGAAAQEADALVSQMQNDLQNFDPNSTEYANARAALDDAIAARDSAKAIIPEVLISE